MDIKAFPSGPFSTNAYVISCTDTKIAAMIDPAPKSAQGIIDYLSSHSLTPDQILLTHSHWDHIGEVATLKEHYGIPVFIHPLDAPNLRNPGEDGLPFWGTIPGVKPDGFLEEEHIITVGKIHFKVIHTPGHTPGGICLYCEKEKVLFSGDTLFKGSIGNLSLPTANADQMWESLEKLAKLSPDTEVYPGHGPATTIGEESWLSHAKEFFNY